jgi:hypothetical protein
MGSGRYARNEAGVNTRLPSMVAAAATPRCCSRWFTRALAPVTHIAANIRLDVKRTRRPRASARGRCMCPSDQAPRGRVRQTRACAYTATRSAPDRRRVVARRSAPWMDPALIASRRPSRPLAPVAVPWVGCSPERSVCSAGTTATRSQPTISRPSARRSRVRPRRSASRRPRSMRPSMPARCHHRAFPSCRPPPVPQGVAPGGITAIGRSPVPVRAGRPVCPMAPAPARAPDCQGSVLAARRSTSASCPPKARRGAVVPHPSNPATPRIRQAARGGSSACQPGWSLAASRWRSVRPSSHWCRRLGRARSHTGRPGAPGCPPRSDRYAPRLLLLAR